MAEFRGVINDEGVYRIQKSWVEQDNTEHWVFYDDEVYFNSGAVQHQLRTLRALNTPPARWIPIDTQKAL